MEDQSKQTSVGHYCEICSKGFSKKSNLQVHVNTHRQRNFKCNFCTFTAVFKSCLTKHYRTHTKEKPYKCSYPNFGSYFARSSPLKAHQLLHNKDDPTIFKFLCPSSECPYKTYKRSNLNDHLKVHSKAKPFACDLCPYRAKRSLTLMDHRQTVHSTGHDNQFKYPQLNCNYSCKRKFYLASHIQRVHSDDRPFVCPFPECNYTTKTNQDLKNHQRIHGTEKTFKCPFCSFATNFRGYLTVHIRIHIHIRTHTGETPNACQNCAFQGKCSPDLKRHVKIRHLDRK